MIMGFAESDFCDRRLARLAGSVDWVSEFELMQASGMSPWIFLVETRFDMCCSTRYDVVRASGIP